MTQRNARLARFGLAICCAAAIAFDQSTNVLLITSLMSILGLAGINGIEKE